jgi:hypothetical protein
MHGESLADYFRRLGLSAQIGSRPVRVTINGCRVPREIWRTCRPKAGTRIHVQAVVEGGGEGNKILRTIAFIALAATTQGMAAKFGWGPFMTAGAIVAGSIAVNSKFPPPEPKVLGSSDGALNLGLGQ